jgi:hypothetical protein
MVGLPLWRDAFVYSHRNIADNAVVIPLVREGDNKINGAILVNKRPDGSSVIEGMTRNELLYNGNEQANQNWHYLRKKLGYLDWMRRYEKILFGHKSQELEDCYCRTGGELEMTVPPLEAADPCPGFDIYLCIHIGSGTFWTGEICHMPPHLDHDRDCVHNADDPDFIELGVDQTEFEQLVREWWEQFHEDEYGDYDVFWEQDFEYYVDPFGLDDWFDWEGLQDSFQEWLEDLFDGDQNDPFYYNDDGHSDLPCPYDDPPLTGGGTGDRTVQCGWFHVWDTDCVHDPWWQWSYELRPEFLLSQRIRNYCQVYLQDEIDCALLEKIALISGCDPTKTDFETCVMEYYHNRRTDLENIIDNLPLTGYNINDFLEITINCAYPNGFQSCVSNTLDDYFENFVNSTLNQSLGLSQTEVEHLLGNQPLVLQLWMFLNEHDFDPVSEIAGSNMLDIIMDGWLSGPYPENQRDAIIESYNFPDPAMYSDYVVWCAILQNQWEQEHPGQTCNGWCLAGIALEAYWKTYSGVTHTALDLCGLIPVAGEPCDVVNGVLYTIEGDGVNAALSFSATIPVAGWVATGAKYALMLVVTADGLKKLKVTLVSTILEFSHYSSFRQMLGVIDPNKHAHHLLPWNKKELFKPKLLIINKKIALKTVRF